MEKELSQMSLEELWELFPIILKPYNKEYPKWYEVEKDALVGLIGEKNIFRINHIGSTAVPEIICKPTIDILLEIRKTYDINFLIHLLNNNGWTLMFKNGGEDFHLTFNKGYTNKGFAKRVFHLHVKYPGDHDELYFKDYLVKHSEVKEEYEKLKQELFKKFEHNRDGYTNAKTDFVKKYTQMARIEFGNIYRVNI